jgi:hypothetical protein
MITAGEDVVTVVQGVRQKVSSHVRIEYAKGPVIRREMQSKFDAFPANKLHEEPAQSPADAQAAFEQAVATAKHCDAVVMVLGE